MRIAILLAVAWFVAAPVGADIVVIKEGVEVSVSDDLDAAFASVGSADIVNGMADTAFSDNLIADVGYPDLDLFSSGTDDKLMIFDLESLPGFAGGTIHVAQLRIRQTAGNAGGTAAPIVTHDWDPALAKRFSPVGSSIKEWGPASDSIFSVADAGLPSTMAWDGFETGPLSTYEGWLTSNVTADLQAMADGTPNRGWHVWTQNRSIVASEHAMDAYRPALFISYTAAAPPQAITDLAVVSVDWGVVELEWTAPADNAKPAAAYDVRYSTAPITEANWDSATLATGEPTPAAPGTIDVATVTGLDPLTTYYFAIKSSDAGGLISDLSNAVSDTTLPLDVVTPAAVTDLTVESVHPNWITISFTARGDDGDIGTASVYDVRYSESPIVTEGDFAAATQLVGEPVPSAPGTDEVFNVTGLNVLTTYDIAVKVGDEVPNYSGLSNVVTAATDEDLIAPDAIDDLQVVGAQPHLVYLRWTAPADNGSAGVGAYDVRYASAPIDDANWDSAIQATGEPVPSAPGTIEEFILDGLGAESCYYFAAKAIDRATPANVSALSNVDDGCTTIEVQPVVVVNPWIVNDRVADCRSIDTIGATFFKDYTPDGVVVPTTNEQRVINAYNNMKRRYYHWTDQPPNYDNMIKNLNVFGWALCGRHADCNVSILDAIEAFGSFGIGNRKILLPGHWIYEAQYDGKWHTLDSMTTMYVYNRATPPNIASCEEIKQDHSLMLNAVAEGRACPGYLLCGDSPDWFVGAIDSYSTMTGGAITTYSMDMTLALGESLDRTWESWTNQHPPAITDVPYHHESHKDWNDTVNFRYWEPYEQILNGKATYRRWSNGTITIAPDFTAGGAEAAMESSTNIMTLNQDGLLPQMHVAATGTTAEAIFHITTPFYLTSGSFDGQFVRNDSGDLNRVSVSTTGTTWTTMWENTTTGSTTLTNESLGTSMYGKSEFWVKVELEADGAITDAGVNDLAITLVLEHNKGAMAYLDKGVNNITVTLDNPADLVGKGVALMVRYTWKEYDGSDWTISQDFEQQITTSPQTFQIVTGGTKVPRTESIVMEVVPALPDFSSPASITDLVAGNPDATTIDLTWTATGDDGVTGRASVYDIRYHTDPIDAANWDDATPVSPVPSPKSFGNAEQLTVTGLTPLTTYYFAIVAKDEVPNSSGLSNVASATTMAPDLIAPETVTDLVATTGAESGSVELSWTAPGDDGGVGTAVSYDVRYQPAASGPITAANWASATQVVDVPTPGVAGSAESMVISGLTWGASYYFAITASDEVPNVSDVSNSPVAQAAALGEVTLQAGLDGYTGCRDNYMYEASPTSNYGSTERLTLTGYASSAPGEKQRGLVKFDVSSIPSGTAITNATLYLYAYDEAGANGSGGAYGAYRITTDWGESTSNWSTPWTAAGGDAEATPDGTAPKVAPTSVPAWVAINVTARVQQWINDPSGNYGWLIKFTDETLNNQDRFYSSDAAQAAYRPKLVISDLGGADSVAPGAIVDLVGTNPVDTTVRLAWTATGDDGGVGTAMSYDLRYRTYADGTITEANWLASTPVTGPMPQAAGSAEQFDIVTLSSGEGYYLAIKALDEVGNASPMSNVVDVWVPLAPRQATLLPSKDSGIYGDLTGGLDNRGLGGRMDLTDRGDGVVDNILIQFDMAGAISSEEIITGATLDLFAAKQSLGQIWDMTIMGYPLNEAWGEGVGTTGGVVGSTGYPWGPTSVGDATYLYKQVTAVAPDPSFGNYDVATAGIPWAVPGARGVGSDVANDVMISHVTSGTGFDVGDNVCTLTFTPAGVGVLNAWARGTRANNGMNLFPDAASTGGVMVGTKDNPDAAVRPVLTLLIGPAPVLGDIDDDGDVDIDDLAAFVEAMDGPNQATSNPLADLDGDSDCDMADFGAFAAMFTGS